MQKYIIGIVLLVLIAGGAYYLGVNKKENNPVVPVLGTETQVVPQPDNSGMKKYIDSSMEFEYPDNLISVTKNGDEVNLGHSIDYKHGDFCDMKGDGTVLDKFTDFNVSLRVVNKNIKETLDETQGFLAKDIFANGAFKLSPGRVDTFDVGSLKGHQITSGVEGCGAYTYYFSITSTKTLVVARSFVPELSPINADNKTYLGLAGVILPDQEVELFTKILTSLKVN